MKLCIVYYFCALCIDLSGRAPAEAIGKPLVESLITADAPPREACLEIEIINNANYENLEHDLLDLLYSFSDGGLLPHIYSMQILLPLELNNTLFSRLSIVHFDGIISKVFCIHLMST